MSFNPGDRVRLVQPSTIVATIKLEKGEVFEVVSVIGEGNYLAARHITPCPHCSANISHLMVIQVEPEQPEPEDMPEP